MTTTRRPNVVLVMTDDQGYGDLSCHGNPLLSTPAMDALHADSVRLADFHVDPTCAPTRAALMTGCYSHRAKVWHTIAGRNHLDPRRKTMAECFRSSGYRTGLFGKWHLGDTFPLRPMDRGFDQWLGQGDGGVGAMTNHWGNNRVDDVFLHNGVEERRDGYSADVFFDAAIDFIGQCAQVGQPFFTYIPTYIPHDPCSLPDPGWADRYRGRVPIETAYFFASIERADWNLARLRTALEKHGVAEETILVFLTDNGTAGGHEFFNAGMRGHKGTVYEGGHRVPCFLHWPAGGLAGGRDINQLTAHIDLLPTLAEWCGLATDDVQVDGRSLGPLIAGDATAATAFEERTLVVENQRLDRPIRGFRFAVMRGRHRLLNNLEFYDLAEDPGQETNLIEEPAAHSAIGALQAAYDRFWNEVSQGDEVAIAPVVGNPVVPVVTLTAESMNHRSGAWVWNQCHVTQGTPSRGVWPLDVAVAGDYRVAVRRWPREVSAPIRGQCPPLALRDRRAFLFDEAVDEVLYASATGVSGSVALPVTAVRLSVDDACWQAAVDEDTQEVVFTVSLKSGRVHLEAVFLTPDGAVWGSAYYVVVGPASGG